MKKKVKLFANCIPVKGINRSVICDLQRGEIKLIPNDLYDLLNDYESYSIDEIKNTYDNKFDDIIDEYFDFLISNEYVFLTTTPELFPKLEETWFEPCEITNSIIDLDKSSNYDYLAFINQLESFNCKHLEIRFFETCPTILLEILKALQDEESIIHSVDVIVSEKFENIDFFKSLFRKYPRLNSVILYNSKEANISYPIADSLRRIVRTKENLTSSIHCGAISSLYFSVNIKNFTESLRFNSCLNKKISVDGNLKNCPSMLQNFGNIEDTELQKVLDNKDFKKYWNINKNQIATCKDCEFRYICTDCRAYIENPEDKYSKPLKCGYDPYTGKWEEWSTNPLKQKAIEHYNMRDLIQKNG